MDSKLSRDERQDWEILENLDSGTSQLDVTESPRDGLFSFKRGKGLPRSQNSDKNFQATEMQ